MNVTEEDIAKILELVPDHPSVESLGEVRDLQHLTTSQIREALKTLVERGYIRAGELFGRD